MARGSMPVPSTYRHQEAIEGHFIRPDGIDFIFMRPALIAAVLKIVPKHSIHPKSNASRITRRWYGF